MKTWTVVCGIIRNEEGKILMLEHKKAGKWTMPLGKLDEGETLRQAVKREVKEEVNIEVQEATVVSIFTADFPQGKTTTYVFDVTKYAGAAINAEPAKHTNMKWMTVEEINSIENLTHATKSALEYLNQ